MIQHILLVPLLLYLAIEDFRTMSVPRWSLLSILGIALLQYCQSGIQLLVVKTCLSLCLCLPLWLINHFQSNPKIGFADILYLAFLILQFPIVISFGIISISCLLFLISRAMICGWMHIKKRSLIKTQLSPFLPFLVLPTLPSLFLYSL